MELNMNKFDELLEAKLGIQVSDSGVTIKDLKKLGVKASQSKKYDDEVEGNLKDKDKVKNWMLGAGWDLDTLKDIYPELLEAKQELEVEEEIVLTEEEMIAEGNVQKDTQIGGAQSETKYAITQFKVALKNYKGSKILKELKL